uniref:Zinc finger CCCH-type with G patch domain-containing protein n=1 Tax=Cacopsylla melanoneura TaxID=428564 RepID=A0A8D8LQN4_9HEMI
MSSFDDEYALFKQEIEGLDSNTGEEDEIISNTQDAQDSGHPSTSETTETSELENVIAIENELNYLKGHKCQAPYYHTTSRDDGTASYHNALVISVHTPDDGVSDINDINVKVVFTHPICKPMLTCPFYFDGDCKYSEERCFFSHGYLVKFIELKEYKNISYDHLHLNQLVLAKNLQNNIWYRAKIVNFDTREDTVSVQFETGEGRKGHERGVNNAVHMELENIYPLDSEEIPETVSIDSESDDSLEDMSNTLDETFDRTKGIEVSLSNAPLDTRLGDWEKYTKGMGSKLMMKMGYVIGSGLGKNSEGRVEPVETYILPQGKSLDYCMNLREKCGGGEDMFKMEKMNKKITMRQEKRSKQNYEAATRKEKQDVFGFLNKNLNQTSVSSSEDKSSSSDLNNANTNLNVETFKIAEKIKKYEKQLGELNKSLKRHENDKQSEMFKKLTREISIVNSQINTLNRQDSHIHDHMKKQFNKKSLIKF